MTTDKDAAEREEHRVSAENPRFDVDDSVLPSWVEDQALSSGNYPYPDKMPGKDYDKQLERLQIELVKLQAWLQSAGERVMILFEGRDAAGKGGAINAVREYMNPRTARNVALTKPTEAERGQWYFQRYVAHFPTKGEFVTFDRSWYNRAGVEPVMGFCTSQEHARFLAEVPGFERGIANEGIRFFKFWLAIGREMQLKRFHDRRHSPLKNWKFSPMDVAGISKWEAYTQAYNLMFARTHAPEAPWIVVLANDKRRARLEVIRRILQIIPYEGADPSAIGQADPNIIGEGLAFLDQRSGGRS